MKKIMWLIFVCAFMGWCIASLGHAQTLFDSQPRGMGRSLLDPGYIDRNQQPGGNMFPSRSRDSMIYQRGFNRGYQARDYEQRQQRERWQMFQPDASLFNPGRRR